MVKRQKDKKNKCDRQCVQKVMYFDALLPLQECNYAIIVCIVYF